MNRPPVVGDLICHMKSNRNSHVLRVIDITTTSIICVTASEVSGCTRKFYKNPKVITELTHDHARDSYHHNIHEIVYAERKYITDGWSTLQGFAL